MNSSRAGAGEEGETGRWGEEEEMRTWAGGGPRSGRMKAISERRCDMIWLLRVEEENGFGDWGDMQGRTAGPGAR